MITVTKIDITTEIVGTTETNELNYYVRKDNSLMGFRLKDPDLPSTFDCNIKTYRIYKYFESRDNKNLYFALQDKELFDKILKISTDRYMEDLQRAEFRGHERGLIEGRYEGYSDGIKSENQKIKSLSWWKKFLINFND